MDAKMKKHKETKGSEASIYGIARWVFLIVVLGYAGYAYFTLYPLQRINPLNNKPIGFGANAATFSLMLVAVGLVTFYGFMALGNRDNSLSKGDVRLAIVASTITTYLVLVGTVAFFRKESGLPEISSTVLNHFTTIVGVVIAFYFGTAAYEAVHKGSKESGGESNEESSDNSGKGEQESKDQN